MEYIDKYFPSLNRDDKQALLELGVAIKEVNDKINVISRRDTKDILLHHIITALSIKNITSFKKGDSILDIGSGGGLPGLPLAIISKSSSFTLIDSRKKKCEAMTEIATKMNIRNVRIIQVRSNELKEKFDYVVGRAVTDIDGFLKLAKKNLKKGGKVIYISGGEVRPDIKNIPLNKYFSEDYFKDKHIYVYP